MQFDVRHIAVPFRFQYGHALKQHRGLQAVVCRIFDGKGNVGLGEAVPREYVTGETCDSILSTVQKLAVDSHIQFDGSVSELIAQRSNWAKNWHTRNQQTFPSCVMSALDLARCDLWAQQTQQSLAQFLSNGQPMAESAEPYCASIGFGRGWKGRIKLQALLTLYQRLGFRHFKVKVGTDSDEARVRYLRNKLGTSVAIFADANAAWSREEAANRIQLLAKHKLWAIEEPLQFSQAKQLSSGQVDRLSVLDSEHYRNYRWLRERSSLPLIADESLICAETAARIVQSESFDLFNIRLSKCGGPLLSIAMAQSAAANKLKYSVAAMVGESPILATAGAHFGVAAGQQVGIAPKYLQGYSHGLLHKTRFCSGEPKLKRAKVTLKPSLGLGLTLDEQKLNSITVKQCQFQI